MTNVNHILLLDVQAKHSHACSLADFDSDKEEFSPVLSPDDAADDDNDDCNEQGNSLPVDCYLSQCQMSSIKSQVLLGISKSFIQMPICLRK